MISEQFFEIRRRKIENLELDNVTFVLNCVDVLAGDESFVPLRKQRLKHRTLERLEALAKNFIEHRQAKTKEAEDAARGAAQGRTEESRQAGGGDPSPQGHRRTGKGNMLMNFEEVANRRLKVKKASIKDEKRKKIQESKGDTEQKIRRIQNNVRAEAVVFPPVPPLLLGLVGLVRPRNRERTRGPTPTGSSDRVLLRTDRQRAEGHRFALCLNEDRNAMKELHKTLIFVAVALLLTGAAAIRAAGPPVGPGRHLQRPGEAILPRLHGPAGLHGPGSGRLSTRRPHCVAVPGQVQGRQVGHPFALQLSCRRQGPPGQDRGRCHGSDQGHDPLRPRRGPGRARRDRPARRQGDQPRVGASGSPSATKSEKVLADFIIGKEVQGSRPRSARPRSVTSACRVRNEPTASTSRSTSRPSSPTGSRPTCSSSTPARCAGSKFDNHKVDPRARRDPPGEVTGASSARIPPGPWTIEDDAPPGQELNTEKISDLTTALADLKIVGVRPKPAGLTRDLQHRSEKQAAEEAATCSSLQAQGVLPDQGRLSLEPG